MKLKLFFLILLTGLGAEAAAKQSEFEIGRACYTEGEFKKAVSHFQLAVNVNPDDAKSYYWMGMSYQVLADIAFPFSGKYNSKARASLTKATELAPDRLEYRKELFDFLLGPAGSSRASRRQASAILQSVPPQDADYEPMRRQFERESRADASADARLAKVFLAVPRAVYSIADIAVPGSSQDR